MLIIIDSIFLFKIEVWKWPNDIQECNLKFLPWTMGNDQIDLNLHDTELTANSSNAVSFRNNLNFIIYMIDYWCFHTPLIAFRMNLIFFLTSSRLSKEHPGINHRLSIERA